MLIELLGIDEHCATVIAAVLNNLVMEFKTRPDIWFNTSERILGLNH